MLMRFLFGDDIFISYSRRDGAKYAAALANELSKPGNDYTCFLDQWGASAANELSKPVLRAIERSSVLVLIGTAGAAGSQLVQREVKLFSRKKRLRSLRPVLPINIDDALTAVSWAELTGLHRVPETDEARSDGVPSQSVIRLIADSYSYTKRAQRTRWLSIVALILLISSVVVGSFAAYQARRANAEARRANAESQRANEEAQAARVQAEEARNSQARADAAAENAQKSAAEAKRQQGIADEKAREAEFQAKAATENARTARSQELSAHAKAISSLDPHAAVLEALDAVRVKTTPEAEDALRTTLLKFPEQRILSGHGDLIFSTDFSPDDRYVVTTTLDGIARIWNVQTGQLVKSIEGDRAPILTAAISPNGKYLVLSGMKMSITGLDSGKGPETADNRFVQIRDFPSGEIRQTFRNQAGLNISFSRDGRLAVLSASVIMRSNISTSSGAPPVVLDLDAGKTIKLPEDLVLGAAVFTPENKVLIAGLKDFSSTKLTIEVTDLKTTTSTTTNIESERIPKIITAGTDRALTLQSSGLALLNSRTGEIVTSIQGSFNCAEFSKSGQLIVAGDDKGKVTIYAAETGALLASFDAISANSVSFTPDERHLVVGGADKVLRIWRVNPAAEPAPSASPTTVSPALRQSAFGTFAEVAELTGHAASIMNVKIGHTGDLALTAATDGTVRLWNLKTSYAPSTPFEKIDGQHSYWDAAFSPLGERALTVGRSAHVWATETGAHLAALSAQDTGTKPERRVMLQTGVFSRTGKLIIIDGEENDEAFAELFDSSGALLAHLPGWINMAPGAAISYDDKFVAFASGKEGLIWSITEKKVVKRLTGHVKDVASIAFSPNGTRLITAGKDGTARLWSFPDGKPLEKAQINSEGVYDAAFSPNGRYAFIKDSYYGIWLWDTIAHKVMTITGTDQTIMKWGFSGDSTLLFTLDLSGKTLVRTTSDGRIYASVPTAALAFTPNGKFLIDTQLRVWNANTGRLFSSPVGPDVVVKALYLTKDNQLTAITERDSIIRRKIEETSSLDTLLSIAEKRTRKPSAQKP